MVWSNAGQLHPQELMRRCIPLVKSEVAPPHGWTVRYFSTANSGGRTAHKENSDATVAQSRTRSLRVRVFRQDTIQHWIGLCTNDRKGVKLQGKWESLP